MLLDADRSRHVRPSLDGLLSDPELASALLPVWAALPQARLVGGVVRDLLAGRAAADIDLATPLPPERAMALLRDAGLKVVATGFAHGTVTAVSRGRPFEITTLRRDERTDGRHADVAWTADWREDAARRDFTINAMSMDREGVLHDYFGGRDDLAAGRVRFVGEAARRIAEDRLRILRFFRFQARFGRVSTGDAADAEALAAIAAQAQAVRALSPERIWMELQRLFATADIAAVATMMQDSGVWQALFGDGADVAQMLRLLATGAPVDPVLRLATLTREMPAGTVAEGLRLSRSDAARLAALADPLPPGLVSGAPDDELRRALADRPAKGLIDRLWLEQALSVGAPDPAADNLRQRLAAMPTPVFPLTGRDGLVAGLRPGPAVGVALAAARRWWHAGGCVADRDACLAWLRRHVDS